MTSSNEYCVVAAKSSNRMSDDWGIRINKRNSFWAVKYSLLATITIGVTCNIINLMAIYETRKETENNNNRLDIHIIVHLIVLAFGFNGSVFESRRLLALFVAGECASIGYILFQLQALVVLINESLDLIAILLALIMLLMLRLQQLGNKY